MSNSISENGSVFLVLSGVDFAEHVERKGNLSYISWSWAWRLVKTHYPLAFYTIYENRDGWNYHTDGRTCWVKVGVSIEGLENVEYLPVMDARNQAIPLESVTSFDVNRAIQRAITKACARHGLGLSLYAGEDLPDAAVQNSSQPQRRSLPQRSAPQLPETPPPPSADDYYPTWKQSRSQYVAGRNNQTL